MAGRWGKLKKKKKKDGVDHEKLSVTKLGEQHIKTMRVGQLFPFSGIPGRLQPWNSYTCLDYMEAIMEPIFVLSGKQRRSGEGLRNSRAFLCHLHFCHLPLVLQIPWRHTAAMMRRASGVQEPLG